MQKEVARLGQEQVMALKEKALWSEQLHFLSQDLDHLTVVTREA